MFEWRVYVETPKKLFRKTLPGPAAPGVLDRIRAILIRAGIAVTEEEG